MSIQSRTVFYDKTGGIVRFWDWALTSTTLGSMAEPFVANERTPANTPTRALDPTDEICRIDHLKEADIGQQQLILSGGYHYHGGTMHPRVGR